jgi:acetolactate synthase I/II/III large subunit
MKVHSAVSRALHDNHVSRVFGLLGDANMQYISEYIVAGGVFVNAVHEGGAVSMADGCARMSGTPAVVSVTHGPGVTNTMTALTEAVRAGSPVLLLSGDTPPRRDFVQHIDLRAVATVCGADYRAVLTPEHLVDDIAKALQHVATTRVPMLLDIGYQLLDRDVDYVTSTFSARAGGRSVPDDDSLDAALGIIASANRPVVLAGVGAVRAGAHDELVALAARLGAPLATTLLAKDFFRADPFNLGIFGTLSHRFAIDAISSADCVIAFGASLNSYTAADGALLAGKAVVHCDVRPQAIGRYCAADVAVVGDAKLTAASMLASLQSVELPAKLFCTPQLQAELDAFAPADEYVDTGSATTLDVRTAIVELDRLLPADRAVVTDCGRFMRSPWKYLHVANAGSFQHTVNFGSIGLGLATAIGAAVARPDRLTVAVAGDGGAMMGLIEFTTAVREQLPFVAIILNDGCYGAEYTKLQDAGLSPEHSLISWPEFADVAVSMGGHGISVRTALELKEAAAMVAAGALPLLIDVKMDPSNDIGILS